MKRILVIEDEAPSWAKIEGILTEAGMHASVAADGEEAVELLRKESFDMVISDWNMPKMGGGQVLRWMRTTPAMRRTPFVILSDCSRPEEEAESFYCGADDYMAKPYASSELLARVERLF